VGLTTLDEEPSPGRHDVTQDAAAQQDAAAEQQRLEDLIPLADMKVIDEMQLGIALGFAEVKDARAQGKPVVYSSVVVPKEILHAMDIPVVYGEVLGAYASMFGKSARYCQFIEDQGLSRDTCAIQRCTLGVALCEDRDEFFNLAWEKPDLVVATNFPCMSESRASQLIADYYHAPYFMLDLPINTWGAELPEHAVRYTVGQLQRLIDFFVDHGYPFDLERLREEVRFSRRLAEVLRECDRYKRAVPTPIKGYDNVIATCAPIALGKAVRRIELFERFRDELRDRVERGYGVVPEEKLRLLWVGIPPLADFKLLDYPERHGAVVAKSMIEFVTGFNFDPTLMDPERPLESIARAQLTSPANPLSSGVVDFLVRSAKDYQIDGVVSVVKRTCGLVPGLQRLSKEAITAATGAPSIVFDLDGVDAREHDPAAARAMLDSFIETLLARKGGVR